MPLYFSSRGQIKDLGRCPVSLPREEEGCRAVKEERRASSSSIVYPQCEVGKLDAQFRRLQLLQLLMASPEYASQETTVYARIERVFLRARTIQKSNATTPGYADIQRWYR